MALRIPLPGMHDGTVGKGAIRYPDLCLCYDNYAYRSGPPLPQLDDYYEDISPQKREEQKRIANLTKQVNHPSVNKVKFFKTEYVDRRLRNKEIYSSFSSLNDSIFARQEDGQEETGKASAALNYSESSERQSLNLQNRNIHIPYRPIYKPTVERVFQQCSAHVAADVRTGKCLKAAPVNGCPHALSLVTIPQVPLVSRADIRPVVVERK
ncbi:hypothetical protein GL50803_0095290 [Giardia duodenalis]|uniref:Uncharacterized protein n=1 Tax=Giardia intestinalis (strain ATCC 50803 / WB clone C6) TaxID=184922 RepID=D3KGU1_GIAIC|nr:hypothetical protein GL50803_0095290 [Giardia intestinalis]KAE8302035.1 hypothetical protein GL50803_0095290 [Giardia intestinalis]